jgi:hypothetical protein
MREEITRYTILSPSEALKGFSLRGISVAANEGLLRTPKVKDVTKREYLDEVRGEMG